MAEIELNALLREVRGLLAYEEELGGPGLPYVPPAVRAEPRPVEAPIADARRTSPGTASAPVAPLRDRLPEAEVRAKLTVLADQAAGCTACGLHATRTKSVFARGSMLAEIVFVGEGPGENEDLTGLPFVGAAGQLLDKMIVAMGFAPDDVYVCNVVKCRPPGNRTPEPAEANACAPFLVEQLALVQPKVIVALGKCAADNLGVVPPAGGWRGRWGTYQGVPVMPTYHPAYLLRAPENKRQVWDDLKLVLDAIGRKPRSA